MKFNLLPWRKTKIIDEPIRQPIDCIHISEERAAYYINLESLVKTGPKISVPHNIVNQAENDRAFIRTLLESVND